MRAKDECEIYVLPFFGCLGTAPAKMSGGFLRFFSSFVLLPPKKESSWGNFREGVNESDLKRTALPNHKPTHSKKNR